MSLFLYFIVPLIAPFAALYLFFVLVVVEIQMVSAVLANHDLSRGAKAVWSVLMVPFLPVTALVYCIYKHFHHFTPYAAHSAH